MVENYFSTTIRRLYTDGGGEFIKLRSELVTHGITHLLTPPHTPEHNGLAERKHRHLVETGITLLHYAKLPTSFWSFAFSTAIYLINRLPSSALRGNIPYTLLFNLRPNYHKLRIFGCLCYPWLRPYSSHKLDPRSRPCIFLGYCPQRSAYRCFDPNTQRLFVSRHVVFVESQFPGYSTAPAEAHSSDSWLMDLCPNFITVPAQVPFGPSPAEAHEPVPPPSSPLAVSPARAPSETGPPPPPAPSGPASPAASTSSGPEPSAAHQDPATPSPSHRPPRPSGPPPPPARSHQMVTRAQHGIFRPKKRLFHTHLAVGPPPLEPLSVREAMQYPEWNDALYSEHSALLANNTWDLVPRLPHYHVLGNRWVYRVKHHPDGSISRFKTRLVAKGYHQRPGLDFTDTFSPVVKPVTVRTVFTLALSQSWPIAQFDVNNAFLQGPLQEEVYMVQPPGFVDPSRPDHVCRLRRAIYGLRQAPRAWYTALSTFLVDFGFTRTHSDASLFVYSRGQVLLYFLVYVDDLLLTGNDPTTLTAFQQALSARFSLKALGDVNYFLGIEVIPTGTGYILSQHKYMVDVLNRFMMTDATPVSTPLAASTVLSLHDGTPPTDATRFRQIIGALQYLVYTRPDIAYSVNKLSQYMHSPTASHWQSVKRLLRYVSGTLTFGLSIRRSPGPLSLTAFADADWAGDRDDRSSTSGYLIYLGSTLVSWRSQKQRTVARSSTEAEYRAIANATAELEWVRNLLSELRQPLAAAPTVYSDNLGATYFSSNPVFHSRMKHLALDYHFVRQLVQSGRLHVSYIPTTNQLADALTKPLPSPRFLLLRAKIGVVDTSSVLRGRISDK
ncbi:unnamed protein product [Linum trigynum]|uniref:Integrase catalytic domain-containing protein n=1 Tax=Linum trigynum TaxID=586398 RepID=A0AAV2F1K1_9ROSI